MAVAATGLVFGPTMPDMPPNPTIDQMCMNPAYEHRHRALCADPDVVHPADYN